jgi:hypothetical protein
MLFKKVSVAAQNSQKRTFCFRYDGDCPGENIIRCADDPDLEIMVWQNLDLEWKFVYLVIDSFEFEAGSFTLDWKVFDPNFSNCLS